MLARPARVTYSGDRLPFGEEGLSQLDGRLSRLLIKVGSNNERLAGWNGCYGNYEYRAFIRERPQNRRK